MFCSPLAHLRQPLLATLAMTALVACGGGGGGGTPIAPPTPTTVAPLVSQPPASRAVAAGSVVTFAVAAVGSGPFTYQWQRDGSPIAGAVGATFTTPATTLADDGARFSVVVANSAGTVTSAAATLTVFPPPGPAASCSSVVGFSALSDATVAVGKVAGAVLAGCSGALVNVTWTQVAGPAVPLLSARTQAISFEPASAATYSFSVSFTDVGGTPRTQQVDVTASGSLPASHIVARVDQAVREGQRASVRAWPTVAGGDTIASITWAQVEGPAVELDTSDPARILFTAPAVAQDTVLRFRVTLGTGSGASDSDDVRVVVENLPPPPAGQLFDDPWASRVYRYRASSPFAADLERCVFSPALFFNNGSTNLCTLRTLPLLAQTTGNTTPTVAQVMDRVLVSHDWMGARFEAFLNAQMNRTGGHDDFLRLLGSVNAIVIGAHVRPSFYWSATGAIYLDADNLWLTPEERDVVSEVPDARVGFDRELNYTGLWRYVVNTASAFQFFDPAVRAARNLDYLDYELGSLLYHELAHANDFFPPAVRASVPLDALVFQAVPTELPSDRLAAALPLASAEMFGLARVKFFGEAANASQKSWTPRNVADFFRVDRATDEYNYSVPPGSTASPREDLAMLFEEFMMTLRYNARRDVGMTNKLQPGMTGSDLFVAWGQRGRIAEASVQPRIERVRGEIAPWVPASSITALPAAIALREGASWTANLNPAPGPVTVQSVRDRARADDPRLIRRLQQWRTQRALPKSLPGEAPSL